VLGRRADGYHELDSIVAFADVGDRLVLSLSDQNRLNVDGPFAASVPLGQDNIIWKAWSVLNTIIPMPFVSAQLTKNLPLASGIGGGSADAAAMLRGLLRLADRSLNDNQVIGFAKSLGADVPVCFYGKTCRMQGIGENISMLTKKLPAALVLANPMVSCSTPDVFQAMGLARDERSTFGDEGLWRNDMTKAAVQIQPVIADVLRALKEIQIGPVRMSGSGATCFAEAISVVEAENEAAELRKLYPKWWVKAAALL